MRKEMPVEGVDDGVGIGLGEVTDAGEVLLIRLVELQKLLAVGKLLLGHAHRLQERRVQLRLDPYLPVHERGHNEPPRDLDPPPSARFYDGPAILSMGVVGLVAIPRQAVCQAARVTSRTVPATTPGWTPLTRKALAPAAAAVERSVWSSYPDSTITWVSG